MDLIVAFLKDQPAWVLGLAAGFAALWLATRRVVPFLRRVSRTIDRFLGTDAQPGVLELLQQHGDALAAHGSTLAEHTRTLGVVKHEVEHNSGGSIKDAVKRLEEGAAAAREQNASQDRRIGEVLTAVASLGGAVSAMQAVIASGVTSNSSSGPHPTASSS